MLTIPLLIVAAVQHCPAGFLSALTNRLGVAVLPRHLLAIRRNEYAAVRHRHERTSLSLTMLAHEPQGLIAGGGKLVPGLRSEETWRAGCHKRCSEAEGPKVQVPPPAGSLVRGTLSCFPWHEKDNQDKRSRSSKDKAQPLPGPPLLRDADAAGFRALAPITSPNSALQAAVDTLLSESGKGETWLMAHG
ncbi:hypothetical protein CMUS01_06956 [Colletotrichum musicola]|uniref:Uncharacterized protein n=1 Tax=Colletotrichum musicola TaxID=2175873 RepID=A0A8H6KIY5_9PEZI|nr:hypothetical protein CMUS01_06956 [Colletotrichum musicola]